QEMVFGSLQINRVWTGEFVTRQQRPDEQETTIPGQALGNCFGVNEQLLGIFRADENERREHERPTLTKNRRHLIIGDTAKERGEALTAFSPFRRASPAGNSKAARNCEARPFARGHHRTPERVLSSSEPFACLCPHRPARFVQPGRIRRGNERRKPRWTKSASTRSDRNHIPQPSLDA